MLKVVVCENHRTLLLHLLMVGHVRPRDYGAVPAIVVLLMCSRGSRQMAAILDQKNYLEELNRHLKYDSLHSRVFFFCS